MNTWQIRSESDTDRVWEELDNRGNATGVVRYELGLSLENRYMDTSVPRPRRWAYAAAAGIGAAVAGGAIALAHALL